MSKKGAIQLSSRIVLVIILLIVLLILLIFSIFGAFREASFRFRGRLSEFAPPPTAVISSPDEFDVYHVSDIIEFDGSESYDRYYRIVGYFWDIDGDLVIDKRVKSFDDYYYEPGEYNLTLKVANEEGKVGVANQVVKVYTKNKKVDWLNDLMFLIRDNKDNKKDILKLISVTTWNDMNGLNSIPYYVYYIKDDDSTLSEEQIKDIMKSYGKKKAYVFDDAKMHSNCLGTCQYTWDDKNYVLNTYDSNDLENMYLGFWELYEYIVLVDPSEEGASLIAALFAAFYNSPILFVDNSNLNSYKAAILNNNNTRQVYYIPSSESIDKEVHDFIVDNNIAWIAYPPELLRDPSRRVNRIVKISSNVTIS